jgi:ADP-ribose pyrophosphatase YjhB (NUDIX family)
LRQRRKRWFAIVNDAPRGGVQVVQSSTVKGLTANTWKEQLARALQRWPLNSLLAWGVRVMTPRQRVGVALVAFNSNEEVFMLRHVFRTERPWGLPGGWLGRNEAPADGLARELREETGLNIHVGPILYVGHEKQPPHVVLIYLGWVEPGPISLSAEVLEAQWFALDCLPRPLWPLSERAVTTGLELFRATPYPSFTTVMGREAQALT